MADVKITNLPEATTVSPDDELLMVDVSDTTAGPDGTDKRVVLSTVRDLFGDSLTTNDVVTSTTDDTAGRLLTVGYGGLGGTRVSKTAYGDDLLTLMQSGSEFSGMLLEIASATTTNKPDIAESTLAGIVHKISSNSLTVYATFPLAEQGNIYTGYYNGSSILWRKSYDSGNTNFNEFGGVSSNDFIGSVTYRNSVAARFYRPLSGWKTSPSSISVTGTFKIITRGTAVTVITGIPASDIAADADTSNCELNANIRNIDGTLIDPNLEYVLVSETSSSKITAVA